MGTVLVPESQISGTKIPGFYDFFEKPPTLRSANFFSTEPIPIIFDFLKSSMSGTFISVLFIPGSTRCTTHRWTSWHMQVVSEFSIPPASSDYRPKDESERFWWSLNLWRHLYLLRHTKSFVASDEIYNHASHIISQCLFSFTDCTKGDFLSRAAGEKIV